MIQDIRYGLRTFGRARGLAITAILAIALAIGANTAIFSIVNSVLLKPLPYRDSEHLVLIQERIPQVSSLFFSVSAPDVLDMQRRTRSLDAVAGFQREQLNLSGHSRPKRINAARVSANLFPMLGISPQLGRSFTTEDDSPGHPVAVLSYDLWQAAFGADPNVLGSKILLDGAPYVVLGVMPRGFNYPPPGTPYSGNEPFELWLPMAFTQQELADVVDNFDIGVLGHMKPAITHSQLDSDMTHLAKQIEGKYSDAYKPGQF
jgi:hypothetical protein